MNPRLDRENGRDRDLAIVTAQSRTVGQGAGSDSSLLVRKMSRGLAQAEPRQRPVDGDTGADEVVPRYGDRPSGGTRRLLPIMKYSSAPSFRSGKS